MFLRLCMLSLSNAIYRSIYLLGSEMPSGHQSVDMLIKGRYFDSNHSNSRDGRNDDGDGDDDDLRDVKYWPPLMKGEFTLS